MGLRRFALLGAVAAALVAAAPAQAINDPVVPGDNCSADQAVAVGDPLGMGNPGINFHTPQPGSNSNATVSPPVSNNNPGNGATGAKGQARSPADNGICFNTR
jgi:hypothetical protein